MMLSRHVTFLSDLKLLFGTTDMSVIQAANGNELIISVYKEVVEKVAERVKSVEMANPVTINVREMPVILVWGIKNLRN